jgi:hypothetical protein
MLLQALTGQTATAPTPTPALPASLQRQTKLDQLTPMTPIGKR